MLALNIQGGPKNLAPFFMYVLTLPNINRFSQLFHSQNQEKICNDTVAKDSTTPQVCRYTTLWNVSVIKVTIENKTTSVTTHFKKLTTGNNVFIVSVIVTSCRYYIRVAKKLGIIFVHLHRILTDFHWSRHWSVASPAWVHRPARHTHWILM